MKQWKVQHRARAHGLAPIVLCLIVPAAAVQAQDNDLRQEVGQAADMAVDSASVASDAVTAVTDTVELEQLGNALNTVGSGTAAPPAALDIDALEKLLAEQKAALEAVEESLAETREKEAEVQEKLAETRSQREETESEIRSLCEQQEEIEPGSLDQCLQDNGG